MRPIRLIASQRILLPLCAAVILSAPALARGDSYPNTILADKPVAYYRLEEINGDLTAVDSSTSGAFPGFYWSEDGIYPMEGQPGIATNSAYFRSYTDESGITFNSYVEVPYAPELNPQGPFSAEAWVRSMTVPTGEAYRSPVCNFGGWTGSYPGWFFYETPETKDSPSTWLFIMGGGAVWIGGVTVQKAQWEHLVATFDGTNVIFYINGVPVGGSTYPTYEPNPSQSLYIGSGPSGDWLFDGNVDEVAIYTNVLSADQIALHYQVGLTNIRVSTAPASIIQDPVSVTQFAGRSVQFTVGADGAQPLDYQWYRDNTPIPGATRDTLRFDCTFDQSGSVYKAVVTNTFASATSATATLTVDTNMTLDAAPQSVARVAGGYAAFEVVAGGALPFSYQWYKGSVAIPGATQQMLWIADLKPADDGGTFYARVSNPWVSTNTDPATLNVYARTSNVPITGYAKIVMADKPVGYWRLDQVDGDTPAFDAAGNFDGTYDPTGAGSFTSGGFNFGVATGIPSETNKAVSVFGGARVAVPWALELNPRGPFAAEAWLQPASLGVGGQDYRTAFSSEGNNGSGPTGWLLYQQPTHTWAWVICSGSWAYNPFIVDMVDTIVANQWYHIVLNYDGTTYWVYVNGQMNASLTWDGFVPNRDGDANFGWRSLNDWKPYNGVIDDVAFYNKVLTPDQIQAHYANGVRLSITRLGAGYVLSWPLGTLQQSENLTAGYSDLSVTSPYTNSAASGTARFFRVKVQ